jgi:(E)-4-hydroxy-3-methyl-but-2-enyl pyrophosphate reductase
MEIIRANAMGFCFGVRDAIEIVRELGESGHPVYTLGAIVHNPQVAQELDRINVHVVDSLDEAPDGALVAITAHGAPPDFEEIAISRGFRVVDTTCPLVTRIQKKAMDLVNSRHSVLVYGDATHKEVKGIVGWSGGRATVFKTMDDLDGWKPTRRVAIIAQSTSNTELFREIAKQVVGRMIDRGIEITVVNTICKPTKERQGAVRELARQVDVVLAVGGQQSANTRKLMQAAEDEGARAYQVQGVDDVLPAWFEGVVRVGITAGASTPDWVIDEVESRVRNLSKPELATA